MQPRSASCPGTAAHAVAGCRLHPLCALLRALHHAETGLAAVQLTSDLTLHKLPLDDISEWTGPADWDD